MTHELDRQLTPSHKMAIVEKEKHGKQDKQATRKRGTEEIIDTTSSERESNDIMKSKSKTGVEQGKEKDSLSLVLCVE